MAASGSKYPGVEMEDIDGSVAFLHRSARARSVTRDREATQRLARLFASTPEIIFQELVETALDVCNAGSAGISLQETAPNGDEIFRWIATAGMFASFLGGTTPRSASPCGTCLDRHRAQLYSVAKPYYDFLGIEAEPIVEGILIPWEVEETRGTIWIVSHDEARKFDCEDYRMAQTLADFAAIGIRYQADRKTLLEQTMLSTRAELANELAHQINNPLQSVVNALYLAEYSPQISLEYVRLAMQDIEYLSTLVKKLLSLYPDKSDKSIDARENALLTAPPKIEQPVEK